MMPLRALGVSNLKCFAELRLAVAPLTLFTGFNSAGKSTALQAILLLSQGLRSGHNHQHLPLNGPLVRLGSAGDVLSNRTSVLSSTTKERIIRIMIANEEEEAEWNFNPPEPKIGALQVEKVNYRTSGKNSNSWVGRLWDITIPSKLISAVEDIVWISAERGRTADAYPTPDDAEIAHADVGNEGQYAPWWYADNADNEVEEDRRHPNETAGSLRRQLDAYLSDLFPGAQATADEIARTSLVRLGLRAETTSDWRRPANMGYGLTYAFPLLVALLLARQGQIVIIDSPEAHLHPRAQSRMGELLARFAGAGVQVLAESHSDHLLNGVRLAVKLQSIDPADVAIHFFGGVDADGGHGVVSPQLDLQGNIEAWPEGFFDQAERDLSTLIGWD